MTKRITIATTSFYPDGMASTYRIHCYAKGLLEKGVKVNVVATDSQKGYNGKKFFYKGNRNSIPFTLIWNRNGAKSTLSNYIWAELSSYILFIYCIYTVKRYDVLFLYGMGLIPKTFLIPILHLFGKKVIMELNEYPYSTEGNKYTKIPWIKKTMQWCTFNLVIPQLDGIIAISENIKEAIAEHSKVSVVKIPILADVVNSEVKEKGKPHKDLYMFHAGSLSVQKDGILKVVEAYALAANKLKKEGIRFDFVITNKMTYPHVWEKIEKILNENGLSDNLTITGYLNDEDLHAYLKYSSVLLINKPPSLQNKYNFPTKLGDYLLSGRPVVVASKGTELTYFLNSGKNSIVLEPDDVQGMAESLVLLCRDEDYAKLLGKEGKVTAVAEFDYKKNADKLIDFLNSL